MKTLAEYMTLPYRMELTENTEEGGFTVTFPDLPGCMGRGDTLENAVTNAKDAQFEWLAAAIEAGVNILEPDRTENYSGQFKLRIPKTLHRALSEHAKKEGISMNQYCLFLLTRNDAIYTSL